MFQTKGHFQKMSRSTVHSLCAFVSRFWFVQPKAETVSVTALVGKLLSGLSFGKLTLPHFLPAFDKMFVNRLLIDLQHKVYTIDIAVPGTIVVIKDILSVSGIRAQLEKRNGTVSISFSANGQIFDRAVTVQLQKKGQHYRLLAMANELEIKKLLKHKFEAYSRLGLPNFSIKNLTLEILWGRSVPLLSVYGTPDIPSLGEARAQVTLFNFTHAKDMSFFIGFDVNGERLRAVIKSLIDVDIGSIPHFGSVTPPSMLVTAANRNLKFKDGFHVNLLGMSNIHNIKSGFQVDFYQNVSTIIDVLVKMAISKDTIRLQLPQGLSLHDTIAYFAPKVVESKAYKKVDHVLGYVLRLQVATFIHQLTQARTSILGRIPQSLDLFKGKLKLKEAEYNATLHGETDFALKVIGKMELFKKQFEAEVSFDSKDKELSAELKTSETIALSDFTPTLKSKSSNMFIQNLHLDKLGIATPHVEVKHEEHGFGFR